MSNTNAISTAGKIDKKSGIDAQKILETKAIAEEGFVYGLLIENPINRYLVNSPMLPDLKKNTDGSLTLYIHNDSPGKNKEANWQPAPDGPA